MCSVLRSQMATRLRWVVDTQGRNEPPVPGHSHDSGFFVFGWGVMWFPFPSRNHSFLFHRETTLDGRWMAPREALVVTPLSPRKRSFHERNDGLGTLVCESCTEISAGVGIGLDREPTKLQRPLSLHSARCAALLVEPARDPSPNNKLVIQPYHPISQPCGYVPWESNANRQQRA